MTEFNSSERASVISIVVGHWKRAALYVRRSAKQSNAGLICLQPPLLVVLRVSLSSSTADLLRLQRTMSATPTLSKKISGKEGTRRGWLSASPESRNEMRYGEK